jgi:hypothetical protein
VRTRSAGALAALALGASALAPCAARAQPIEYLPTTHWAYEDLSALAGRGVVDSLNLASRPWSRVEIARALDRADGAGDPLLARLEREFAKELVWIGRQRGPRETPPLLSLRDEDSEARLTVGVDGGARGAPPEKMRIDVGSGLRMRAQAYLGKDLYLGAEVRAQRTGADHPIGDSLVKGQDFYLDAGETYVTFAPRGLELLFGLTRMRWGAGTLGTLLLSDAADPYPTFGFRKRFAGALEFRALHGTLVQSDRRHVAMHRLTWFATETLSIGIAEGARYDAEAPELLYLLNLVPYTLVERFSLKNAEKQPEVDQRNNVMMAADVVWRIGSGARVYGEFLLDDLATETADMPHRMAWQLGAAVYPKVRNAPVELLFEYSKVFRFTYSVFYDRNYIFSGRPLGFVDGPDVERYAVRLKADPAAAWSFALDAELLRGGEGYLGEFWDPSIPLDPWSGLDLSGVVESTVRLMPSLTWIPRDNVWLRGGAGLRSIRNPGHADAGTETDLEAFVELDVRK